MSAVVCDPLTILEDRRLSKKNLDILGGSTYSCGSAQRDDFTRAAWNEDVACIRIFSKSTDLKVHAQSLYLVILKIVTLAFIQRS